MIKKILKILAVLTFFWVGYQVIYTTPNQRAMTQEINSHKIQNTFTEGFEGINSIAELFNSDWSRWHELITQNNNFSIRRPVRYCLINPAECLSSQSLGNYIELATNIRRRGKNSLKFHATAFEKKWFGDSRIAIRRQLFEFKKDDDIYFSGWFYFEGPENAKFNELDNLNHNLFLSFRAKNDSLRTFGEPGPSLFFSFRNHLGVRFDNWLPSVDEVQQDLLNRVQMPVNQWVEIKVHLKLSDVKKEGIVEIWLNDKKIIAERAQTLPRAKMKYSILEVGIGSNLNQENDQTMYVDNLRVSPTRFSN